ncbi:MAG: hypothetical protein OHK006_09310 [Thermodesulfovibrionales bacterium]
MPKATGKKSSSAKAKPARKAGTVRKTAASGKSARKTAAAGKMPKPKKPAAGKPAAKKAAQKKPSATQTAAPATAKPRAAASGKPAVRKKPASAQKDVRHVTTAPVSTKTLRKKALPAAGVPAFQKGEAQPLPMSARLQSLKQTLIRRREDIVKEAKQEIAKYISGETRQLVDTAIDEGDWAVVDISEDISLRRLSAHRKMLLEIDEALRKIGEGTYGICEECGEEIAEKRLIVLPTATLCVDCKENREKFEDLEEKEEL